MTMKFPEFWQALEALAAVSGSFLVLTVAAVSVAAGHEVGMCPSLLTVVMGMATAPISLFLAFYAIRITFAIYDDVPAAGFMYSLLLAVFGTAIAVLVVWFFFDLTAWWARDVEPFIGDVFLRQCF
ncbi:hypothetical protein [Burkholderia pyrrocinia]